MAEIWAVDDIARRRNEVANIVKNIDDDIRVLQFQKAQDALQEIYSRANNNSALPNIIVLDRNLATDKPPYDIGENVVTEIRAHPKFKNIIIVAHSSIASCNDAMLAAGANIAIPKNKREDLKNYIEKILK